jgi:DNA-binding transcriptional ArsR family regulator
MNAAVVIGGAMGTSPLLLGRERRRSTARLTPRARPGRTYNRMVVGLAEPGSEQERLDLIFHALSDSTRRGIVRRVLDGERSVSSLAREYPMSFAAVQKHVAVLERAELVTKERRGREQLVRANLDSVRRAAAALEQLEAIWLERLERFEDVLSET